MSHLFVSEDFITQAIRGLEQSGLVRTDNYISHVYGLLTEALRNAITEEELQYKVLKQKYKDK